LKGKRLAVEKMPTIGVATAIPENGKGGKGG
jgi:hypothetical protein